MPQIILHHYPQSPVSEKVRVVLGMKRLNWHSVEIPRLPPKPDLIPLTGGYRRTPVMQIGADIYCDSQCIIREIERRIPSPTLYPDGAAGLPWGLGRWTDGPLFTVSIAVVLGAQADELPQEFAADRGRLYFGPNYDLHALQQDLPHLLAQLRAQLGWIEQQLADGRSFMLGEKPGLPDVICYYLIWFIRGRYGQGPELLREFPQLVAWEQRVRDMGHGQPQDMSAGDALAVAFAATSDTPVTGDPRDPSGLKPGMQIKLTPDGDGGDPSVEGDVVKVSTDEIAIRRSNERVGEVVIHFPRVGYRVAPSVSFDQTESNGSN
ncbi:MAG: glutathione S-transferase family protein [Gammaproteobacteria bacterium]|nr:glutathione S-transferase family protein [Gammaproteobacteria bacterium]